MMHLVTGGSASGKSDYAESLALKLGAPLFYVATMRAEGPEGKARVERHRKLRDGKGFTTLEWSERLLDVPLPHDAGQGTALLECVGTLVSNELYDENWNMRDTTEVLESVTAGIARLGSAFGNLVVVTNEVGAEGLEAKGQTGEYIRLLGSINCELASQAVTVTEVTAGLPTTVKGAA